MGEGGNTEPVSSIPEAAATTARPTNPLLFPNYVAPNPAHGDSPARAAADPTAGAVGEEGEIMDDEPEQLTVDEPKPEGRKPLEPKQDPDTAAKDSSHVRPAKDGFF